MKKRRKFTTTKNTHGGLKKVSITSKDQLNKLELENMENNKGPKIGLNLSVEYPNIPEPITFSGVYHIEGYMKNCYIPYIETAKEQIVKDKLNMSVSMFITGHIYNKLTRYIKENNDDSRGINFGDEDLAIQLVEYGLHYCMNDETLIEESKGNYNKYYTLYLKATTDDDNMCNIQVKGTVHKSFESFQNKSYELFPIEKGDTVLASINTVEQKEEDVDQVKIVDEPIDYTIDDIQIVDDAPIPMLGLNYEILTKLKHSMTILQVGQTIKLPKDDRLRSSVYLLNKQHFSDKRFSVYEINDNYIVFLNNKNKE
jgi:hypothetical protein